MTARDYLKQIKKIDTQLKNKTAEEKRAREIGLDVDDIAREKTELKKQRSDIIHSIEQLPEAEYDVLHRIYFQYETLYEVANERKISYSLATTIHGRALKRLENIINANN